MSAPLPGLLAGKRGLVVGIANDDSIAAGCARAFSAAGPEITATYLNAKAEPHVRAVTKPLDWELLLPCDLRIAGQLESFLGLSPQRSQMRHRI